MTSAVALIPARGGSQRIPAKNVRDLRGHPLIAYSIAAARRSGRFARVVVSTDSEQIAHEARRYGAEVPWLRPASIAGTLSPDIEWVQHALSALLPERQFEVFSILRPTSPLRTATSIAEAFDSFVADDAHSLRAVERCHEHPGKMWVLSGESRMRPLLDSEDPRLPMHSQPYQALPEVYVQNASLEIAWVDTVRRFGTIAGTVVRPFILPGHEAFDLNYEHDWWMLEHLLDRGEAALGSPHPDHDPEQRGSYSP